MNGCGCIQTNLYLQKQVVDQICQPLTTLEDTQEMTSRLWSSLPLCKMETVGSGAVLAVVHGAEKGTGQVVDAEAKTRGPQWKRLSFLLQKKHLCFIPGHTRIHTQSLGRHCPYWALSCPCAVA